MTSLGPGVTSELPLIFASNVAKAHQRLFALLSREFGRLAVSLGKFHCNVAELPTRSDF